MDCDYLFKVIVIGDSGTGKTSLLSMFALGEYRDKYISTIGVDFKLRTVVIDEKVVKIQIWDTAGQERFKTITTSYYKSARGILLVFDLTDMESFRNIVKWKEECNKYAYEKAVIILVGTKSDLYNKIEVKREDIDNYCNETNIKYFETSSKESIGVEETFMSLARQIKIAFEYEMFNIETAKSIKKETKKETKKERTDPMRNSLLLHKDEVKVNGVYDKIFEYC